MKQDISPLKILALMVDILSSNNYKIELSFSSFLVTIYSRLDKLLLREENKMKNVVIIGAGPAGLSCAYEILKNNKNIKVTIFEEEKMVGGISKTVNYKGNRIDIGGHRFFTKNEEVKKLREENEKLRKMLGGKQIG